MILLSLPKLRFDDDIHRVFLTDSPTSRAQIDYRVAQVPQTSSVFAYVEADISFMASQMGILRDLTLDLEFFDGIHAVASPFFCGFRQVRPLRRGHRFFSSEIDASYIADIAKFRTLNTGLPILITPSATALLIAISVDLDQVAMSDVLPKITRAFESALPSGTRATFTGEDVISLEIVAGLRA